MSKLFVVKISSEANENVCVEKFKTSTQEIRGLLFTDRKHTSSHTHYTVAANGKFFLTLWVDWAVTVLYFHHRNSMSQWQSWLVEICTCCSALTKEPDTTVMQTSMFSLYPTE